MPATGLFFLPTTSADSSPLPDLLTRLNAQYNITPLPSWTLQHRLFRETAKPASTSLGPSTDEQTKPAGPRYLQILSLSHHPTVSYVAITSTIAPSQTRAGTPASSTMSGEGSGEPAAIISIPAGPQTEDFVQLLNAKFGPLWAQRQTLSVKSGLAFEVGDYMVRVGEVVQGYAGGGAALGRGVVVEVGYIGVDGEGEDGGDGDDVEGVVQTFWDTLGVKGARECVNVAGMGEGLGCVRQWCEVLRIRN